jgi:V8-like Glu-specific endopeptidase
VWDESRHHQAATECISEAVWIDETDETQLADAWFADHGDVQAKALSVNPEYMAEVVIGLDDRERFENTTEYPYACICALVITAGDGKQFRGTGWLASPRTVITAGHCVYSARHGGWARQIEVAPGRNGAARRLGSFQATEFYSVRGWVEKGLPEYDYAAIVLPEDAIQADLSSFGYRVQDTHSLGRDEVHVIGYAGDKPPGTLWGHRTPVKYVQPRILVYEVDTYGGNSGGPVIVVDEDVDQLDRRYWVVGIHNYGDLAGNRASRITADVFRNIQKWASS